MKIFNIILIIFTIIQVGCRATNKVYETKSICDSLFNIKTSEYKPYKHINTTIEQFRWNFIQKIGPFKANKKYIVQVMVSNNEKYYLKIFHINRLIVKEKSMNPNDTIILKPKKTEPYYFSVDIDKFWSEDVTWTCIRIDIFIRDENEPLLDIKRKK